MAKQPNVSKPVAVAVVIGLVAVVVLIVVGLAKLLGPGYDQYEGQCLASEVNENDSNYDDLFIDCSDAAAHWEVTKVYTSEPAHADWSSESSARRWLERACDVDAEGPDRKALVFRVNDDRGFLACATALD
ncbi:hypothetical protein [Glycomyces paridis]|uniref:Uncharacterized protein n=1 Tax=Glycomyces paridis TaxID=2126555 RepID=A0A4S8PBB5_9ACTN|nr:hypothetical protein [Glycomyces paridis]THV26442.1 hypothetical protein E9998_17935 [Glycomyces paridis]